MWPNPQFLADLVAFTEEIINGKLQFLCSLNMNKPAIIFIHLLKKSLLENSPNLEFSNGLYFLVFELIREITELFSVFS